MWFLVTSPKWHPMRYDVEFHFSKDEAGLPSRDDRTYLFDPVEISEETAGKLAISAVNSGTVWVCWCHV